MNDVRMKKTSSRGGAVAPSEGMPAAGTPPAAALLGDGDDIATEYDLDKQRGRRNPFYDGLPAGARRAVVAPDVAAVFTDSDAVNTALRVLITAAREHHRHEHETQDGTTLGGVLATIDPDVAAVFGSSVNDALRTIIRLARSTVAKHEASAG